MAQRAGCAATFRSAPAPAGVQSAGECTVSGARVEFRVQRVINTADPWPTSRLMHGYTCVGAGWMYHTTSLDAFRKIAAPVQGG
jgi:hypothetical protein